MRALGSDMTASDALACYLRAAARAPFAWGTRDCALFVADWVRLFCGHDPAAAWRGRYASETDARALYGRLGLAGLIARGARSAGLKRTQEPQPGDIAVAVIGQPVGAICAPGGGFAARLEHGLIVKRAPRVLAAWSVACRQP